MDTKASASASALTPTQPHFPPFAVAPSSTASPPQVGPPHPLSKRTSSRHALSATYNDCFAARAERPVSPVSPPTTPPPARQRTKLREKGKQTSQPQTSAAIHDYTAQTHSHGLSWTSTTRDSVVDNLLFSLDNLSRTHIQDEEDRMIEDLDFDRAKYKFPFALTTRATASKTQRPRGHTYSSSTSSVFPREPMLESPASYNHTPKGRRSHSSSNIGFGGARLSRHRGTSSVSAETQRAVHNGGFSHGTIGEDDDLSTPGADYGYSTITSTANRNKLNRRSLSMDQIDQMFSDPKLNGNSVINRGRPLPPSTFSHFDEHGNPAPEPMVAAGPRKLEYPNAVGPVYVGQAQPKASLRKVTTQSDLRSASMPLPNPAIPQAVRDQATDFVRANSMRDLPPHLQAAKGDSMTCPSLQRPGLYSAPGTRERLGFFRRVFGGSSGRTSASSDRAEPLVYSDLVGGVPRQSSSAGTQSHPRPRHSSKDQSSGDVHPPPALNKKPSSFFRRRKKSTADIGPPPPLPLGINNLRPNPAEASPSVSSLRKVMDPYLSNEKTGSKPVDIPRSEDESRPTTQESEDSENPDIFHSGYSPPPDASLGRRDPLTRISSEKRKAKKSADRSLPHQHGDGEGKQKMKVKKRKNDPVSPLAETSFLLDGPNTEEVSPAPKPPLRLVPSDEADDVPQLKRTSDGVRSVGTAATDTTVDGQQISRHDSDTDFVRQSDERPPPPKPAERLVLRPTSAEDLANLYVSDGKDFSPVSPVSPLLQDVHESSQPSSARSPAFHTATSGTFPQDVHSPVSPNTPFYSATSLPMVQIEGSAPRPSHDACGMVMRSDIVDEGAEYRERARKIYDGDEEDVTKLEAASWLGEKNTLSTKTLEAYMQLFDFSGVNILSALRMLCEKLVLKGETQQFDRIITALSSRWCECNANHGFKAQDVVHTICYSLILLNTDLHLADIGEKMSRSAYVKNTLPTIKRVATDAAPNAFDDQTMKARPNGTRPSIPWAETTNSHLPVSPNERTSFEQERPSQLKRLSIRPGTDRADSDGAAGDSAGGSGSMNALVNQPWTGSMRGWEFEIENVLKIFYASIRSDPLPLHGGLQTSEFTLAERNLSVQNFVPSGLKRSGSVVSKAPSDNISYRSKAGGFRNMTMGFPNKYSRSRPKIYPSSTFGGSSGTSFDDAGSFWSPAQSSSWSKYSASKTLTSASMHSLGTHFSAVANGDFKHSIGFANALSQAIIREENAAAASGDGDSVSMSVPGGLLEDESLALEGAPWAKEGLVQHKHHLEASGKKAKERSWNDCFAVISKGKLTLFAFNTSTSKAQSIGRKGFAKPGSTPASRAGTSSGQKVGGGDWMENAEQLNVFVLRHTITSVLPPPGYSKTRPHVWALSLPSGAVHLFQVGTPEIAGEFMSCANYWSARLSKEPLQGGVSNIEYGWSDNVINPALIERSGAVSPLSPPTSGGGSGSASGASFPPGSMSHRTAGHSHSNSNGGMPRPSFQSSIRGSFDTGFGTASRARLPGDKVVLAEWQPPGQSMMASQLMEVDQLRALREYVGSVERELGRHNELKGVIELAYSPRHTNYARAMNNWQRKSDHLLREIVKFQTYVDSLAGAQKAKEEVYARKEKREAERKAREESSAATAATTTTAAAGSA